MNEVEKAAYQWWRNKRPLSFSHREHLANPTVNTCTHAEARLAKAIADMRRRNKWTSLTA